MDSLQAELDRLYGVPTAGAASERRALIASGTTRTAVLEVSGPGSWDALSRVWRGVQADLDLPAPVIAVTGRALALWFSVARPVPLDAARRFVRVLCRRYLSDAPSGRIRALPVGTDEHATAVPSMDESSGNWSAFVAPDLAPIFDETPWLDVPPSMEGQAQLLRNLRSMSNAAFDELVGPDADAKHVVSSASQTIPDAAPASSATDPVRFLMRVMNDETVDMVHRIEAAKVLLQHGS